MILVNAVTHNWAFAYVMLPPAPRIVVLAKYVTHNACANVHRIVTGFVAKERFVIQRLVPVNVSQTVVALARLVQHAIKTLVLVTVRPIAVVLVRELVSIVTQQLVTANVPVIAVVLAPETQFVMNHLAIVVATPTVKTIVRG